MAINSNNKNKIIRDVCLIIVFGVLALVFYILPPHYTTVIEGDLSISRPASNTIPEYPYVYAMLAITVIALLLWYGFTEKKTYWNVYSVAVFLILSFAMNMMFTNGIKNYVGRPRPSFFALCGYPKIKIGEMEFYGTPGRVADISKCTSSKHVINDAFSSFPSGHSSVTMTIGMYTFLLILRCINEIKGINHYVMRAIKVCIFFVCMLIPIIVGGSRIYDYRHSEGDVLAGYTVGFFSVLISYYLVFGFSFARYSTKEDCSLSTNSSVYSCLFNSFNSNLLIKFNISRLLIII